MTGRHENFDSYIMELVAMKRKLWEKYGSPGIDYDRVSTPMKEAVDVWIVRLPTTMERETGVPERTVCVKLPWAAEGLVDEKFREATAAEIAAFRAGQVVRKEELEQERLNRKTPLNVNVTLGGQTAEGAKATITPGTMKAPTGSTKIPIGANP